MNLREAQELKAQLFQERRSARELAAAAERAQQLWRTEELPRQVRETLREIDVLIRDAIRGGQRTVATNFRGDHQAAIRDGVVLELQARGFQTLTSYHTCPGSRPADDQPVEPDESVTHLEIWGW